MNKKSFLIIGLLFSVGSVLADGEVEVQAPTPFIETPASDFYDEALQKFSAAMAKNIISEKTTMLDAFNAIPEQFAKDKGIIFGYVLEAISSAEETDDRDALINAVEKRTLLVNQHGELLGQSAPSRLSQATGFLYEHGTVIAVATAGIVGYALGSSNDQAPTAKQNATALKASFDELKDICATYTPKA